MNKFEFNKREKNTHSLPLLGNINQIVTMYFPTKELLKAHYCFWVGVYIILLEQLTRRKTRCRSQKSLHNSVSDRI